MSTNLDKSLDEILAGRKGPRAGKRGGPSSVGGVQKKRPQRAAAAKAQVAVTQNTTRGASRAVPTGPSSKGDASKIIVSNLPYDVTEQMIKEYFSKVVGSVKTCSLSYGPNGQSRGIATISFHKSGDAEKAAASYNGVLVDKRPMKVELVLEPKTPGLETRVGQPNRVAAQQARAAQKQPKPLNQPAKTNSTRGKGAARGRGGAGAGAARGGRAGGRPKAKTAEELDAEMADYWDGSAPAPAAGDGNGAQYANATGTADVMEDEVL
ncbi:hypothetical protein DFH27DRAFT_524569 [Peziza echinospora]|nr:hypothetical protein DFH27DRAFT_524569 [Peziza echinospora]